MLILKFDILKICDDICFHKTICKTKVKMEVNYALTIYVAILKYENIGHCFNIIPLWIHGPNMTYLLYANHTLLLGQIVKRSHTLAASTLIILFSEMSRFSKNISLNFFFLK